MTPSQFKQAIISEAERIGLTPVPSTGPDVYFMLPSDWILPTIEGYKLAILHVTDSCCDFARNATIDQDRNGIAVYDTKHVDFDKLNQDFNMFYVNVIGGQLKYVIAHIQKLEQKLELQKIKNSGDTLTQSLQL